MIKLSKREAPAILQDNSASWTNSLTVKLARGEKPTDSEKTRYRHPDIKSALIKETHGKCAYCESKLQHIHHGDVEHIAPKYLVPEKTFEWQNLTLACEICNQNKGNKDPDSHFILDPYVDDPAEHLTFMGSLIFPLGTPLGTSTRILLELHRASLVEMRKERVDFIMAIYAQVLNKSLPLSTRKALYLDLVSRETAPSAAYAAMSRCLVRSMEENLDPELLSE